jgi:hypothetical protein
MVQNLKIPPMLFIRFETHPAADAMPVSAAGALARCTSFSNVALNCLGNPTSTNPMKARHTPRNNPNHIQQQCPDSQDVAVSAHIRISRTTLHGKIALVAATTCSFIDLQQ